MLKSKKLMLGALAASALVPLATIAISCNNTEADKLKKENEELKKKLAEVSAESKFNELSDADKEKFIAESFKKLPKAAQVAYIKKLDIKGTLSMDEVQEVISKLNKDAGNYAGIYWYIKSVEALISKENAYQSATRAFDNLKAKYATTEKFDYSQNFNTAKKVVNAAADHSIPVVFMDIDETVLQNDYTEVYGMLNGGYSGSMKEENDLKAKRRAVPGAVEFINHVHENGGLVLYNSDMNQSTAVRDAVKKNLLAVGVKFVADYQFWMRGSMPYLAENENEITNEKTKDMSEAEIKELAKKTTFTKNFAPTPWRTWDNSKAAYRLGKLVYKTDRMNGLDAKTDGWDLTTVDVNSGNAVVMKTVMRIGDNFNDFFDRASKGKTNEERVKLYRETDGLKDLFKEEGALGLKYNTDTNKFEKLAYHHAYVMVPGNCEYGGWLDPMGYKDTYNNLYKALKAIVDDPVYQEDPTPTTHVIR